MRKEEERVLECERCLHAYPENYGRWVTKGRGEVWLCGGCIRKDTEKQEKTRKR